MKSAKDKYSSGGGGARVRGQPVTGDRYDGFFPKFQGTLAQASAMGTTQGAPAKASFGPPTPPGQQPDAGPSPDVPPPSPMSGAPPVGVSDNLPVEPHGDVQSVGTHQTESPAKQANPVHNPPGG